MGRGRAVPRETTLQFTRPFYQVSVPHSRVGSWLSQDYSSRSLPIITVQRQHILGHYPRLWLRHAARLASLNILPLIAYAYHLTYPLGEFAG